MNDIWTTWPRFRSVRLCIRALFVKVFHPNLLGFVWRRHAGRKVTETSVIEFCHRNENFITLELRNMKINTSSRAIVSVRNHPFENALHLGLLFHSNQTYFHIKDLNESGGSECPPSEFAIFSRPSFRTFKYRSRNFAQKATNIDFGNLT